MAHAQIAPSRARSTASPLRPFIVTLYADGQRQRFTALARSTVEAIDNALALPGLTPPVAASARPDTVAAMRVFRKKLALSDLVE